MNYTQQQTYMPTNRIYHLIIDGQRMQKLYAPAYNPFRQEVLQLYGSTSDPNDNDTNNQQQDGLTKIISDVIDATIGLPIIILGGLLSGGSSDDSSYEDS
jgi:hypothetical protein